MNPEQLMKLARETRQICQDGQYCCPDQAGVTGTVWFGYPDGPASSLIHPDDWPDIEQQALAIPITQQYRLAGNYRLKVSVENVSTIQALRELQWRADGIEGSGGVMVLNFASGKNPGGGWERGTDAQEESLARGSNLVESLERWPRYYRANRECGSSLYTDHAIWSPDVTFFRDQYDQLALPAIADVLTIPAPNLNGQVDPEEAAAVLKRRVRYIVTAAAFYHQKFLVLGAWGCGVFKNDPEVVARLFRDELARWPGYFRAVVFAVLDSSGKTFATFKTVLS
jgi:uncharacterized protein (TIGR02452 family)